MFKKLFGPFPDECWLYGLDRILGIFPKFKFNSKTNVAAISKTIFNSINDENFVGIPNKTTAKNKSDEIIISQKKEEILADTLEISTQSSKKYIFDYKTNTMSCTIDEKTEISEQFSTPSVLVKKSSSMECNYTVSKINVGKFGTNSARKAIDRQVRSSTKSSSKRQKALNTKLVGASVDILESCFERKVCLSDNKKNRVESILKKESKLHRTLSSGIKFNFDRSGEAHESSGLKTVNSGGSGNKDRQRKVIKSEWALTRVFTFDDDSQTYEVMKKDKGLDKKDSIERIFAIAPNATTVAYNPLKHKLK